MQSLLAGRVAPLLRGDGARVAKLAIVVFLWQAAVGIYFLSLVQQYLPQALHAGLAYPGYAMASYGVAKFAWQPAAGWIADRIGRRVTMVAGMALSIPALTLMMSVPDARAFLGFSALLGIGAATMWPAFMAHVGDTTPRGRRARTMSLLNIAQMTGIGLGTLCGVLMVDYVTYSGAFWACMGFSVLALAMVVRGGVENDAGQRRDVAPAPAPRAVRDAASWTPGLAMLSVIVLFLTLGTSLHTPMIGAYTHDVLRVRMSFMALLFPAPAALAGFALWKFGHLTDRYGRHVPLVAGLFVASLSIFALTLTRNPFIAVNFVVLAGLAYAVSIPAWGAAALDATDVGGRGLLLGVLTAVQGLGVAAGQALGGVIGGFWGPLAPFKLAALLLMVALLLILSQLRLHARRRRAPATATLALAPAWLAPGD
ncbi:MAG TPA: MFS transporter [Dehalococcoidia bacterium]|nr:MFS transporter [Dehalococcoidia bacterium]